MVSFLSLALSAWGVFVLLMGQWGLSTLMASNQCEMTYSRPMHRDIAVQSAIKGYTLIEAIHNDNTLSSSAKPVLFVPGHSGRYCMQHLFLQCWCNQSCYKIRMCVKFLSSDQLRSLASYMHNSEGRYRYFALDFKGSRSGLHGSHILAQAAFLNDALRAILETDLAGNTGNYQLKYAMTLVRKF